jgi:Methane oxygenase PmoA
MTDRSARFTFNDDLIALPKGAWAATERRTLRLDDRPILSLTQGRHRNYVFPLYTPAGFLVTSEAPADHPHHSSCWIAADHVHCKMPAAGNRFEDYTYNFYLNETFQGRAPGRILETGIRGEHTGPLSFRMTQELEWRGPVEWAAPAGRVAARETRMIDVAVEPTMYVLDIASRLEAADWDFTIGPTRHAYFNVRVAESISVTSGGTVRDDRGKSGNDITGDGARWVDYCGPVGGGNLAGVTVLPSAPEGGDETWFVTDWGVVTVGPFRNHARAVRKGESTALHYRVLVHDGPLDPTEIASRAGTRR